MSHDIDHARPSTKIARRGRKAVGLIAAVTALAPGLALGLSSSARATDSSTPLATLQIAAAGHPEQCDIVTSQYGTALDASLLSGPNSLYYAANGVGGMHANWLYNQASAYDGQADLGQGVDVALIDSGVAPLPTGGLTNQLSSPNAAGNLIVGPDFSFDSQSKFAKNPDGTRANDYAYIDTYGHGTHMGGIIAGSDKTVPSLADVTTPPSGSNPAFYGIAPRARIVSVKVADSSGAVDVSQLIAAIDWVVQHRHDGLGLNIRVISLSIGLDAYDAWTSNALSYAVQQAWKAGIVVLASTGNGGAQAANSWGEGIASPAFNHDIIAVGGYDTSTNKMFDKSQSAAGTQTRAPDLVAPAVSIPSLHVPGSAADDEIYNDCVQTVTQNNAAWSEPVFGINGRFVKGTGTSQATAMAAGAAALMISKFPWLTPDQLKYVLTSTARDLSTSANPVTASQEGKGAVELAGALSKAASLSGSYKQQDIGSVGGGDSLDLARGCAASASGAIACKPGARLGVTTDPSVDCSTGDPTWYPYPPASCNYLTGDTDWFGNPISVKRLEAAEAIPYQSNPYNPVTLGSAWVPVAVPNGFAQEAWNGLPLLSTHYAYDANVGLVLEPTLDWSTHAMTAHDWAGNAWPNHVWGTSSWDGSRWKDSSLTGSRWTGSRWRVSSWTGSRWTGSRWRDSGWR